jgi:hypothetical protein
MPRLVNSTAPEDNPLHDAGFCATRPAGTTFGIFPAIQQANAPQPVAFFPLTGGMIDALTLPEYSGTVLGTANLTWIDDSMFDTVPVCNRTSMNAIQLDNVAYGASGPFSVNLWMRRIPGASNNEGEKFQYLFSHSGWSSTPGYSPNQVALYVPEASHPANGTVRAIVKDSNDDPWDLGYLDSDGQIESSAPRTTAPPHADINDGYWHMITLTTIPVEDQQQESGGNGTSGTSGYVLYVDGKESGKISQPTPLVDGSVAVPTGGDPALMSHNIYLCSRSDLGDTLDTARYYDGALANLMLFDTALSTEQVEVLYETYNPAKYNQTGGDGTMVLASEKSADTLQAKDAGDGSGVDGSGGSGLSGGEVAGIVFAVIGATAALIAIGMLAVGALRQKRGGGGGGGGGLGKFERFQENPFTSVGPVSPSYAERGYGFYNNNGSGGTATNVPPGSSSKYPSTPTNSPPSSIQLSSSGQLKPIPSGVLMSEASLPVQTNPSALGLHHVHVRTSGNSITSAGGSGGGGGNPFGGGAAPLAGVSLPSATASPFVPPSTSVPTTPHSPAGTEFSGASGSTMSDDVEIEPGKRNILGVGKKSSARIVLPPSE